MEKKHQYQMVSKGSGVLAGVIAGNTGTGDRGCL